MECGSDYMGIIFNTRVVGGGVLWVMGGVWCAMGVGVRWVLARGGLTMGSGRVAVFWMCWRIVCHPERSEGSRGYFLTP